MKTTVNYAHLWIGEPFLDEIINDVSCRIVEDGGKPVIYRDEYGVQIDGIF